MFFRNRTRKELKLLGDRLEQPDGEGVSIAAKDSLLRRVLDGIERLLADRTALRRPEPVRPKGLRSSRRRGPQAGHPYQPGAPTGGRHDREVLSSSYSVRMGGKMGHNSIFLS